MDKFETTFNCKHSPHNLILNYNVKLTFSVHLLPHLGRKLTGDFRFVIVVTLL